LCINLISFLLSMCFLCTGRGDMKTTIAALLTLWMLGCLSTEHPAGGAPDLAVTESADGTVPDDVPAGSDGSVPDLLPDLDLAPDIDPSSISPGSSCLDVSPAEMSFGGVKVGDLKSIPVTLTACGDTPLRIDGISISEDSSPAFTLDLVPPAAPTPEHPLVLMPGEKLAVTVGFQLDTHSAIGDDGNHIVEQGELIVDSTAVPKQTAIPLAGAAVDINCPTAVIKCDEGHEVEPQTALHLFGDESYASNGSIQKWEWDVDQPLGSQSMFIPSYTFPNPTFEANVVGVYTFYLTVYDQTNTPSCYPAKYEVAVFEKQAIRVELSWDVPGRSDGITPRQLADLDLHFVHPWAGGPDLDGDGEPDGWYDVPFDCFWFNANPNWGSYDPSLHDDPALEEHDDGETVALELPEKVTYKVGVHYFQGSGPPVEVTARVYSFNELVYETAEVELNPLDMWEVLALEWPTGKVTVAQDEDGDPKITPKYQNPYFWVD
jgi:hypothetical protein